MAFELNKWNLLPDSVTEALFEDPGHGLRLQVQEQIRDDLMWKGKRLSPEEIFELLSDGIKYRTLKKAESYKQ